MPTHSPTREIPEQPRVTLSPGVRVVARGRDRWQVGFVDGTARVLRREGPADRVVRALTRLETMPDDAESRQVLAELATAGLVEESTGAAQRRDRRANSRVRVIGSLGPAAEPLLEAGGVRVVRRAKPDLVVRLCVGDLDRTETDGWIRSQRPHLVVRALDGAVVLGPFVVPGETACLACLDAHRTDEDPEHPAVVERYVRATAKPRPDGRPEPVDPALATVATAWAVRDALSFVEGGRPSTWSTTITLRPALGEVTAISWLRHPQCGCAWPDPSGTMGA